jgi:hypothetical protein
MVDRAGELVANDVRRLDSRPAWIGAVPGIDRVDADRRDTHDHMTPLRARLRQILKLQVLRETRVADDDRSHRA